LDCNGIGFGGIAMRRDFGGIEMRRDFGGITNWSYEDKHTIII